MTTTTMTPAEVDEQLAELYYARQRNDAHRTGYLNTIHSKVGSRVYVRATYRDRGHYVNQMTDEAAVAELRRRLEAGEVDSWNVEYYEAPLIALDELDRDDARIFAEQAPLDAEYLRREWSRFFRVTSSDGHIHSSMFCHSTTWKTTFGWHPDLSGKTEAEAVAECGPALCTKCFPSAPVEWTRAKLTKTGKISKAR